MHTNADDGAGENARLGDRDRRSRPLTVRLEERDRRSRRLAAPRPPPLFGPPPLVGLATIQITILYV